MEITRICGFGRIDIGMSVNLSVSLLTSNIRESEENLDLPKSHTRLGISI